MKIKMLIPALLLLNMYSFAQVNELERFRKVLTLFVNYDNGKVDSLPKSAATTLRLKKNMDDAFLEFVLHKDSKNLDSLKKNSKNNKGSYWFNNYTYYFSDLIRDYSIRSKENNVNHYISFYGLYDYKLPDFVSFYIQPFTVAGKEFVVYYYKLNGAGVYYIKDIQSNQVVFRSEAATSNAAILRFNKIDEKHFLLVEDMGYNGQRAMVLNAATQPWKIINAFKGKSFADNSTDYKQKTDKGDRPYLRFAENRAIISLYNSSFLKKYEISFDESSKTISYKQYNKNEADAKTIQAKWEKNSFKIDDYFIGQDLNHEEPPNPD